MQLVRNNTFNNDIVIVDGIGSSGKAMLCHILSSFERVEKEQINNLFDAMPRIHAVGGISTDAAITLLRIETDMALYYSMISRGVNFRPSDTTSIFQDAYPLRYIKRLFLKERESSLNRISDDKPIFQVLTHDGLTNAPLFFNAFSNRLKMVYIDRNPIDIIYDWFTRGFGERIGTDPLDIQLTYKFRNEDIPLSARGWEETYIKSDIVDRVIGMVYNDDAGDWKGYGKLSDYLKEKVMFINFDKLVTEPTMICKQIADFLGTNTTHRTKPILKKERCPRVIDTNELHRKREFLEDNATFRFKKKLNKLIDRYENKSI